MGPAAERHGGRQGPPLLRGDRLQRPALDPTVRPRARLNFSRTRPVGASPSLVRASLILRGRRRRTFAAPRGCAATAPAGRPGRADRRVVDVGRVAGFADHGYGAIRRRSASCGSPISNRWRSRGNRACRPRLWAVARVIVEPQPAGAELVAVGAEPAVGRPSQPLAVRVPAKSDTNALVSRVARRAVGSRRRAPRCGHLRQPRPRDVATRARVPGVTGRVGGDRDEFACVRTRPRARARRGDRGDQAS